MGPCGQFADPPHAFRQLLKSTGYVLDIALLAADAGHRVCDPLDGPLFPAVELAHIGVHAGGNGPKNGIPFLAIKFDPGTFIPAPGIDPGHGRVGLGTGRSGAAHHRKGKPDQYREYCQQQPLQCH